MRNKHPGKCYRCGDLVKKGQGHFERHQGGWRLQHASCAIKFREAQHNDFCHLDNSQKYLILDYETFSEADLKKVGGYEYSKHPSTEVMCASWRIGTRAELKDQLKRKVKAKYWALRWRNNPRVKENEKELRAALLDPTIIKVAHNAMFEQVITLNVLSRHIPLGPIGHNHSAKHWLCTATLAASHALPRKLEDACIVMKLPVKKDMTGHRLMLKHSKPRKPSKNNPATRHTDSTEFKKIVSYCVTDVDAETHLFLEMPPLSEQERRVWILDQKINLRGFLIDRMLVNKILKMIAEEVKSLNAEVRIITNGAIQSANQRDVVLNWLKAHGCHLLDLKAKTVEDAINEGLATGVCKRVLEIRQAVSKTSTAKYKAFELRTRTDGRLRDSLLYWAASTGRWGGKGVQPQNFPRGNAIEDSDYCAEICSKENLETIRLLFGDPMEAFSSILRNMIIPSEGHDLFVSDYAGIEARILFWVAKHEEGIDAFLNDKDLYKEMATVIYNCSLEMIDKLKRFVGKEAILGCGYGMGFKKFMETTAKKGVIVDEKTAKRAVDAYRSKHKLIPILWKNIERAAIYAVENPTKKISMNRTVWFMGGNFLYCQLPSGRKLAYYKPEIRHVKTPWGEKAPKLYHWGVDGYTRKWKLSGTYGGKLVENVVQAIARDLLSEAMIRIENSGFDVTFHVHDELIGEAPKGKKTIEEFDNLMSIVPAWANGAPIKVEGWMGQRYRK